MDKDDKKHFEEFEKLMESLDFEKEKEAKELKLLMFGRDIQRQGQKTIFERILSTNIPVESLLVTVFEKFKLRVNPEFLKMVGYSKICSTKKNETKIFLLEIV